ncbi:uncharacterized protein isoform X2 [Rhodnius prolixus]
MCTDLQVAKENEPVRAARKFSSSDISGPLPLGTVIDPPRRPPRKKKRRLSRSRSLSNVLKQTATNLNEFDGSNSVGEISLDDVDETIAETIAEEPKVHLTPLVVPVTGDVDTVSKSDPISQTTIPSIETTPPPPIQEIISQNKRTFLATLLEENNNLSADPKKDVHSSTSRRSSITESLREFESSLYDMLQENAEDERSEHSLNLPQVTTR